MPHANWKGYISFGLVNIPIVLYSAQDPSRSVSFKQIDRRTGAKIKYKRIDVETGKEVPWEQIGKGYEYSKDVILPVEEGELKKVAGENARTIAIEEFIDKKNIELINIEKTYYLVPDKKGEKGYVILREALNRTNKVGIAKVIISTKEYLAAVGTYQDALVVYLLHYDEEIRKLSEFDIPAADFKKYKVSSKEIDVAKQLITSMSSKWQPKNFKDEYREAVQKWVEQKVKKLPLSRMQPRAHVSKTPSKTVNFVELLKQSLQEKRPNGKSASKTGSKKSKQKMPLAKRTANHHRKSAVRH